MNNRGAMTAPNAVEFDSNKAVGTGFTEIDWSCRISHPLMDSDEECSSSLSDDENAYRTKSNFFKTRDIRYNEK